jgi:PAS domain S-box-containing protein
MALKNRTDDPGGTFGADFDKDTLDGLLRGLSRCSGQFIFAVDHQYRVVFVNMGCETLLGHYRSDILGSSILDLSADSRSMRRCMEKVREGYGVEQEELSFRHMDGRSIRFHMCLSLWNGSPDESPGYVGAGHHLLDWKNFEEDLARLDRLAEIGRMAAGIVHDLKNPLSIIEQAAGWAGVVVSDAKGLEREDRKELSKTLQEIGDQTARSKAITDQVLDFVREREPKKEQTNLQEIIETVIRYMQPELKYPSIEVSRHLGSETVLIDTDVRLLQQVLVNIMSNAIHAIRERQISEGRIEVRLLRKGGWATISVTDNGTGIPEAKQARIFDLFFTTKPNGKGTGLGLPICRSIVHKLGGELSFRTSQGEGTTFFISLPAS